MLILIVNIHIKTEHIEAFKVATMENARNSRMEPGIARFDMLQQTDDPSRFVLVEVYRGQAATVAHKETAHYHAWLKAVDDMFAEPRTRALYTNVSPGDEGF
ncbi:MAG: antibiotic biosynthesis monooxygenase [Ignavibacteriota bacterium]